MDSKGALRKAGEAVGVLGVIGSLIFVGVEVQQNSRATRAATDVAVADAYRDLNQIIATTPELARAFATYGADPDSAPPDQRLMMLAYWRAGFFHWSNIHRQYMNGTLDRAIYQGLVREVGTYALLQDAAVLDLDRRRRFMLWAWESERFIYSEEFQEFVDRILEGT